LAEGVGLESNLLRSRRRLHKQGRWSVPTPARPHQLRVQESWPRQGQA